MKKSYPDQQLLLLLASAKTREVDAALQQLHNQYRGMITRLVQQNSGTEQDAEEIVSDTLLGLWKAVRSGRYQPTAQLKTYLYRVAYNQCLKRIRQMSRHIDLADTEPIDDLQVAGDNSAFDEQDAIDAYWASIRAVCETCYNVLWAFVQGYSMQEIAVRFNLGNASNAKMMKYNCLKKVSRPRNE